MSLLTIKKYPDEVLRQACNEVTVFNAELKRLLDQMLETMHANRGIGLAGPQVGILKRVTVIDVSDKGNEPLQLVNPKIVSASGKTSSEEGCLSIPEFRDKVTRAGEVVVLAQDFEGRTLEIKADGLLAICLQHEIDHLDGILFIDRLSRLKRELFKRWFKKHGPFE
jgi:peptide deformylase